jgi:hypothetical protein
MVSSAKYFINYLKRKVFMDAHMGLIYDMEERVFSGP